MILGGILGKLYYEYEKNQVLSKYKICNDIINKMNNIHNEQNDNFDLKTITANNESCFENFIINNENMDGLLLIKFYHEKYRESLLKWISNTIFKI